MVKVSVADGKLLVEPDVFVVVEEIATTAGVDLRGFWQSLHALIHEFAPRNKVSCGDIARGLCGDLAGAHERLLAGLRSCSSGATPSRSSSTRGTCSVPEYLSTPRSTPSFWQRSAT
jgi:hypothetical protein